MKIETIDSPSEELCDFFEDRIEQFNLERWEVTERKPLVISVRDESREIVAGAAAKTFGLWLLIKNLWVSKSLRGQGVGAQVLKRLEVAAIARGCQFALLDTLNFQAKPFYEKYGYQVKWTQENYPKDGCKYYMVKKMAKS